MAGARRRGTRRAALWKSLTRPAIAAPRSRAACVRHVAGALLLSLSQPSYRALGSATAAAVGQRDRDVPRRYDAVGADPIAARKRRRGGRWPDIHRRLPPPCSSSIAASPLARLRSDRHVLMAEPIDGSRIMSMLRRICAICTFVALPRRSVLRRRSRVADGRRPSGRSWLWSSIRPTTSAPAAPTAAARDYADDLARSARAASRPRDRARASTDFRRQLADADDRGRLLHHGGARWPLDNCGGRRVFA